MLKILSPQRASSMLVYQFYVAVKRDTLGAFILLPSPIGRDYEQKSTASVCKPSGQQRSVL